MQSALRRFDEFWGLVRGLASPDVWFELRVSLPMPRKSAEPPSSPAESLTRLDRWLWSVRLFKTRNLAASACRAGVITLGEGVAKASREVRCGDVLHWQDGLVRRTLIVRGHPPSRVGAKLVAEFCEETTAPELWEAARGRRVEHFLAREKGAGRPTKRDRRRTERLFDNT